MPITRNEKNEKDTTLALLKSIETNTLRIPEIEKKIDSLAGRVTIVETKINKQEESHKELQSRVDSLEERNRANEQRFRINNIEIVGIPKTKNEDCATIVEDVAKAAGIVVKEGDIQIAHRVPSKRGSIIAQLQLRKTRIEWMKTFKEKRNLTADKVNKIFPNTRVYVNEHLTLHNKQLLHEAKKMKKEKLCEFVWVNDNKILVRKNIKSKIFRIQTDKDIARVRETLQEEENEDGINDSLSSSGSTKPYHK